MNSSLPDYIELTMARKKLLELLSDGAWHRTFPGIGIKTFDMMQEIGFVRRRYIDKNPRTTNNWLVEARITLKGRFLLKHGHCTLRYERDPKRPGSKIVRIIGMK